LKPVRTLFVTHAAEFGGAERSLLEILQHLDRARVHPMLCSLAQGPLVDAARSAGVAAHVIPAPPDVLEATRGDLGLNPARAVQGVRRALAAQPVVRALARLAGQEHAALIYTNSAKAHILGGLAGHRAHIPALWHVRDYHAAKPARAFITTLARSLARTVICNSWFTAAPFRNHPDCRVVYNGLDPDAVRATGDPAALRRAFTLPDNALIAGTAGRLDPLKDIPTIIRAAARIAPEIPHAWFLIAGGALYYRASYLDELRGMARAAGVQDRVIFTGHRSDIYDLIALLHVYVQASREPESFGRSIVEAMLLEKPVAAAEHGGPLEIIEPGRTGVFFPPGDDKALARELSSLFSDPGRRAAMGAAGRARALERFTLDRVLRDVTDILCELGK